MKISKQVKFKNFIGLISPFEILLQGMSENKNIDKNVIQVEGIVEELLPNTVFRVKLKTGQKIIAHISGRMRMHFIKLLPGDTVLMEMSPYDLTKGRIIRRC